MLTTFATGLVLLSMGHANLTLAYHLAYHSEPERKALKSRRRQGHPAAGRRRIAQRAE
jgi:hypothetical protein